MPETTCHELKEDGTIIGRGLRDHVCDQCQDGFRIFQCIYCDVTLCYDCVNHHTH